MSKLCYQCDEVVTYLFDDSRCKKCTRITPDEMINGVTEEDLTPDDGCDIISPDNRE